MARARNDISTIQSIARLLKKKFGPTRLRGLYLFGSRANKTAKAHSDYDFVMVVPGFRGDRMKVWEQCHELIHQEYGVSADVFTYSEAEFQRAKAEFSSIPETAVNIGKELDLATL
jgi:hypothetical protein